ncbi:MAG: ATPase [Oscillospiraceae bacterium]|nr:ATPase [Oscillospiraceae bacterium]
MSIEEILDMMDEALEKAVAVPFSRGRSFIDVDKMSNLVQEIRMNLPREIDQAKNVVSERKALINQANKESDEIIKRAGEQAKRMVENQEITRLARARAQEIMDTAQRKSKELRHTTNVYIDDMLAKQEELFGHNFAEVKKARVALKSSAR